jgi:hypothetical protein
MFEHLPLAQSPIARKVRKIWTALGGPVNKKARPEVLVDEASRPASDRPMIGA